MSAITQELAQFAINAQAGDVPEAVLHEGKRTVLNWIACAVAGSQTDSVAGALAVAEELCGHAWPRCWAVKNASTSATLRL